MKQLTADRTKIKTLMAMNSIGTQMQLAEMAGIHYTTLNRLLAGSGFRTGTVDSIAGVLNANPLDLLTITEDGA